MEILYPAGNIEYIKSAIKVGANAVYGGLKLWNARNKAINFGIDEMKNGIELCHKNGLKFYLTLNTLMFDNEINEVIKILKDNQIVPDAFICADVGLIVNLKKNFPNVPIHISTQFGVHNVSDSIFAKELGAERIILARELTKTEILNIKNNVQIETEIFVWGSQCISFSGSCFLGSFVNGGTANRGKCITLCRDKYCIENTIGNYLYVPDLNCFNEVDFSVDSIKIEGRRRNVLELESVIEKIKNNKCEINNGFILSEFPENNHLYEKVNKRQKLEFNHNSDILLDHNDVWVKEINGELEYVNLPDEYSSYVYTEIKQPFLPEKKNVSLEFTIKNDKICKVMLLNHKGEARYFNGDYDNSNFISFNKDVLLSKIKSKEVNIYSIRYKKEYEWQTIQLPSSLLKNLIEYINETYKDLPFATQERCVPLNNIYIETDNFNTAKRLLILNIPVIFYLADINSIDYLDLDQFVGDIIFKLPMFDFKNKGWRNVVNKLKGKKIMLTKFSQLRNLNVSEFEKVYADYLIPVWNKSTLEFLNKKGVRCFCASPELSGDKNLDLFKQADEVMFLAGGRPTCVYTRQCFKFPFNCKNCQKQSKRLNNYDRNLKLGLKCYSSHREIFYENKILNTYSIMQPNFSFRYIARDENVQLLEKIYKTFKTENYMKMLKSMPEFKDSYSMSLEEDK